MGLTLLERALVSGGLSITYKVHIVEAPQQCETRQHQVHITVCLTSMLSSWDQMVCSYGVL